MRIGYSFYRLSLSTVAVSRTRTRRKENNGEGRSMSMKRTIRDKGSSMSQTKSLLADKKSAALQGPR